MVLLPTCLALLLAGPLAVANGPLRINELVDGATVGERFVAAVDGDIAAKKWEALARRFADDLALVAGVAGGSSRKTLNRKELLGVIRSDASQEGYRRFRKVCSSQDSPVSKVTSVLSEWSRAGAEIRVTTAVEILALEKRPTGWVATSGTFMIQSADSFDAPEAATAATETALKLLCDVRPGSAG